MQKYRQLLGELIRRELPGCEVELSTPPDPKLGDLALPCFTPAQSAGKNPAQVAADLARRIPKPGFVDRIEAKGPYLNFFFNPATLVADTLDEIRSRRDEYGSSAAGAGKRVLIEHTSINPNASPHVGRARNALIGDVLVRLFRFEGYDVEVHYLINDAGKQIAMLVRGAEGREDVPFDQLLDVYVDTNRKLEANPELEQDVFALLKKFEQGDEETKKRFRRVVDTCTRGQTAILKELGITYDVFKHESDYLWGGRTQQILEELRHTGRLFTDEEGRQVLNQEGFGLPLESPYLVLARADGTSLYPLRDLAYTLDKIKTNPQKNVIVLGEDQKVYFMQLEAALELLGRRAPEVVHYSFVLLADGKMSTRKGTVVLLEDFMREAVERATAAIAERHDSVSPKTAKAIAYGAVKYGMLNVANNRNVIFDWSTALNFEGNTGPYIQYSYARICSIFRKYGKALPDTVDPSLITEPVELELVKALARLPDVVLQASEELSPHILTNYVYNVAKTFSRFYHQCPVLEAGTPALTEARLALIDATGRVVKNCLGLLGIEAVEKM